MILLVIFLFLLVLLLSLRIVVVVRVVVVLILISVVNGNDGDGGVVKCSQIGEKCWCLSSLHVYIHIYFTVCVFSLSLSHQSSVCVCALREREVARWRLSQCFVFFIVLCPVSHLSCCYFQYIDILGCVLSIHMYRSRSQYRLSILRSFILTEESLVCRWLWIHFHSLFSWRGPCTSTCIPRRTRARTHTHTHRETHFFFLCCTLQIPCINGRLIELLRLTMDLSWTRARARICVCNEWNCIIYRCLYAACVCLFYCNLSCWEAAGQTICIRLYLFSRVFARRPQCERVMSVFMCFCHLTQRATFYSQNPTDATNYLLPNTLKTTLVHTSSLCPHNTLSMHLFHLVLK